MTATRNIPDKAPSPLSLFWHKIDRALPPKAYFLLALVILMLSALAATDFAPKQRVLTEGEVAPEDISADRTFVFEDKRATAARQDLARRMQPLVMDLAPMPVDAMREQIQALFLAINEAQSSEEREIVRKKFSAEIGEEVTMGAIMVLSSSIVQQAVLEKLLPLAEQRMLLGVLPNTDVSYSYPGGILVRNVNSGEESHFTDSHALPDLKSLEVQLSQQIAALSLSAQAKQGVSLLFAKVLRPTLMPNYDLTLDRADAVAKTVDPVVYRVLRGENIVKQGERVSREQQIKMQVMLNKRDDPFQMKTFAGIALCGLLLSTGLLFSPSSKPGSPVSNKDFIFLATLLVVFAVISKGLNMHGAQLAEVTIKFLPESLAYAVPVAGAAALSSQIFTARRYLVTGLLLSFFCALMMGGGLGLFLFYFMAAMWSTWLTGRSASRRDVVLSVLPLMAGLLAMWAGATLLQGGAHMRYFSEMVAVAAGALLSMVLTFALSPVVEMVFGYTTRFRLMELLNMEQPLLRDLMLNAPGTYHHSLIVSNMCEAGAKRVGAHSLLCKVAALYHDIGKISKAGYFIENQPIDDNPHDRLSPSMSALILIAHVKHGVELAKEHRLGQEVTDIIRQHHGTSVIQFFYRKAMNLPDAPPPNIEDFRYPGPRPRSREAALVMLADIVEASSRTLEDPTPTRLRQHIETIIKSIFATGQLDESELTFKDLDNLADSFQHVLRGLYHHRIGYPGGPDKKATRPSLLKAVHMPAPPQAAPAVAGSAKATPAAGTAENNQAAPAADGRDGLRPPAQGAAKSGPPSEQNPERRKLVPRIDPPPMPQ
ncbi:HDIG domain-containing protein [Desulfovibrio sp. OttesenSCG-928-A18]|nr:HDIG domain-containing protein [Desulfovibrio sp. OttesenSCG-928-A18]